MARLGYAAGTAIGQAELAWRGITGNPQAEFVGSKRHEDGAWMQLAVTIANGGFGDRRRPRPHQSVLLGTAPVQVVVRRPGYLYAYANDAWGMYSNNRGSVTLTLTRAAS